MVMVTDEQVRRLKSFMNKYDNQGIAAAKAGMAEKTGRKYLKAGLLPSHMKKGRYWRTRKDPFKDVWPEAEKFLDGQPGLEALTIFDYLQREYPGKFKEGQLRTLQYRVRDWKALYKDKEVMFPQDIKPGVQAQSDWTCMNSLGITIMGVRFDHLLYHFILCYSNWEDGCICFSENYESLSKGFQDALFEIQAIPEEHRTDNLSAATRKIDQNGRDFTERYLALLRHYGVRPSKNQPGQAHENGDIEQAHYRLKKAIDQSFMLRGSRDFDSIDSYWVFLKEVFRHRNEPRMEKLREELAVMRPLTVSRLEYYTEFPKVPVSRNSIISVGRNIYSVKSSFIGHNLKVRVYPDYLELWFQDRVVDKIERIKGEYKHKVNYRHIISSLVKKPGAFKNYRYKEDLFPTVAFRRSYDWLVDHSYKPDKEYVKILELAARDIESRVENALIQLLKYGEGISSKAVERMISNTEGAIQPEIFVKETQLSEYNELLLEASV